MNKFFVGGALVAALSSQCLAQVASQSSAPTSDQPIVAIQVIAPKATTSLPANTEISLSMNEELTTKGGRIEVGHMFRMSVAQDVRIGEFIVIPRGTPAFGEVTWLTGKGAFGKSGKMEVELRYIDLNGRRIPVSGKYRQEGEGNTVATVAAVAAVGVFGAFVTGKSARIPQGRELKAFTMESLPVALPVAAAPVANPPAAVPVAATASPVAATARN